MKKFINFKNFYENFENPPQHIQTALVSSSPGQHIQTALVSSPPGQHIQTAPVSSSVGQQHQPIRNAVTNFQTLNQTVKFIIFKLKKCNKVDISNKLNNNLTTFYNILFQKSNK
jgi:hypothetical protein